MLALKNIREIIHKFQPPRGFFVILVIAALIGFWFYWFQYRPLEIRKECWQYTRDKIKIASEKMSDLDTFIKARDFLYEDCLRMKGLK